ncbi:MAG TPA: RHS repeat domain-containing protein [Allosphingosinicella sp.]
MVLLTMLPVGPALAQVSPTGSTPVPPPIQRVDTNGVDLLSGAVTFGQAKVSIGTPQNGGLTHSHEILNGIYTDENSGYICVSAGDYKVVVGTSSEDFVSSNGAFTEANGRGGSLNYNSGSQTYSFVDRDGRVALFTGTTQACTLYVNNSTLTQLSLPNGIVFNYTYSSAAPPPGNTVFLQAIQSNTGYMMRYSTSSGVTSIRAINTAVDYCNASAATCPAFTQPWPAVTIQAIQSSGSGATARTSWSVTDPLGQSLQYLIQGGQNGYCDSQHIFPRWTAALIETKPGGGQTTYNYGDACTTEQKQILSVTTPIGGTWTYGYATRGLSNPNPEFTGVSGPNGELRQITWIASGIIAGNPIFDVGTDQDSLGNATNYTYDSYGRVASVTHPEGNSEQYSYDGRGNIVSETKIAKPGSALSNIIITAGYDATCTLPAKCNKPNWIKDGRGNETDFTYGLTHGGILTEVDPADANGIRPAKFFTYAQRYAWVTNGSGGFVHAASPVWVLTSMITCRTTAMNLTTGACAGGVADTVVTAYDYGPDAGLVGNNLLLRGETVTADGATRRACFGYDVFGNKISETKPKAGLAACY